MLYHAGIIQEKSMGAYIQATKNTATRSSAGEKKCWLKRGKKVMIEGEPILCEKCPCCIKCAEIQARIDAGDDTILDFETGVRFEKSGVPCGWDCNSAESTYTIDYSYVTITRPNWTTCSWAIKEGNATDGYCLHYHVVTPDCTDYEWCVLQVCEPSSSSGSSSSGSSSSGSSSSGSSSSGSSSSGSSSSSSSGWIGAGCYKIMDAAQWMEHVDGECVRDGDDPTPDFLRGYTYSETRRYIATEAEYNQVVPTSTHVAFEPVPPDDPYYVECSEGYTMIRPKSIDREIKIEFLGDYGCSGTCSSFYSLDTPEEGWTGNCQNPHFPYMIEEDEIQ